jgi:hypothetical protein
MMHPHFPRRDPGECIVCGAAHCSCGGGVVVEVVQLPARDAVASVDVAAAPPALGDGSDGRAFSTATYRGSKKARR